MEGYVRRRTGCVGGGIFEHLRVPLFSYFPPFVIVLQIPR